MFFALIMLIIFPFVFLETHIEELADSIIGSSIGAPHLAALIGGALAVDAVFPVPSSVLNAAAGATLGFALATLVCWTGMTLGCLFGYWIGATGGTGLIRHMMGEKELRRVKALAVRIAGPALIVMRTAPVLAEASIIAAGAARYPIWRFLAITALANLGVAAAYAGIGAFAWSMNSYLLAFAGAVGIPALAYGVLRLTGHLSAPPLARSDVLVDALATEIPSFSIPYQYPVIFTRGLFDPSNRAFLNSIASQGGAPVKCLVLMDDGVAQADPSLVERVSTYFRVHTDSLVLAEPPQLVPGGEAIKNGFEWIPELYRMFIRNGIDRHSYVIAIGGGAVLDAVGFAAATAHRGVRHIRVPTTVLSQDDSGVGVKNAVNFDGLKNYAGSFAPPYAVLNDFDFLKALPRRERLAGISEAIKVALIRDREFFYWLEDNAEALARFDPETEEQMIRRSAALHMKQIARGGDPFETGSARPLDFGHWAAHKLEALTRHAVPHGEAVAIGVALDTRYSVLTGLLPEGDDERIVGLLDRIGLPTWHSALVETGPDGMPIILQGLSEFQEHLGGALTITLLAAVGVGREVHEMDEAQVLNAMTWLKNRRPTQ